MAQIEVRTAVPSFRRAGITFHRGETTVLDTEALTKKQVEAIRAESMLSVQDVKKGAGGKKA